MDVNTFELYCKAQDIFEGVKPAEKQSSRGYCFTIPLTIGHSADPDPLVRIGYLKILITRWSDDKADFDFLITLREKQTGRKNLFRLGHSGVTQDDIIKGIFLVKAVEESAEPNKDFKEFLYTGWRNIR